MAITRTFQWYRTTTSDPTASPSSISGATAASYTTVTADVGKYLHMKETATNIKGSATATSNVVGPVAAVGTTYSPAPGFIAPITGTVTGNRPLSPRLIKRSEQAIYDGEVVSMRALCDLAINTSNYSKAQTSGRWSDPAIWSNGVPSAGMSAHINSGVSVSYDVESSAQLVYVVVDEGATLRWDTTKDTKLVCDTLHTCPSSYLEIGTKNNPVPESSTAGKPRADIVFIGGAPGTSPRLGLIAMGKVTMYGAVKPEKVDLELGAVVGATTLTVKTGVDVSAWKVGDTLCVLSRDYTGFGPDPQYTGPTQYSERVPNSNTGYSSDPNGFKNSHDEVRTITAISGQTITLSSALTYAHPHRTTTRTMPKTSIDNYPGFVQGQTVTLPARVCNMTRSIRFSSGGLPLSDNQKRAHIMFMASDQVDVRWAEAKNMGRSTTDPTLTIPGPKWDSRYPYVNHHATIYTDGTLTTDLASPTAGIGRYAWHFHGSGLFGSGATFSRNMNIAEGLTAWAPQGEVPIPGWAIVHHNSRLSLSNCVVYNVRGAAFVSENGNEIGQWYDLTAIWCRGDGWPAFWAGRQREQRSHHGHAGVAFENQSRNILMRDCEFSSARVGFLYSVQSQLSDHGWGMTRGADHQSLRLFNPINGANGGYDMPDRDTYGKAASQIPDPQGWEGCDFDQFFRVDHRVEILRGDPTAMIAVGWKAYGGNRVCNFDNYTYKYFFRDMAFWGGISGSCVAFIGTRTSIFGFKNMIVEGFDYLVGPGSQANFGPGWIDIATNLTTTGDTNPNGQTIKSSSSFSNISPSWSIKAGAISGYSVDVPPGYNSIHFTGTIVDGYSPGGRHWPEFQEPSYDPSGNVIDVPPTNGNEGYAYNGNNGIPGWALVERNGVFQSGGVWYMPAYYTTVDWSTFKHFIIRYDHPLSGTWDSAFLTLHTITPTPPSLPLALEDINKPWPVISPPTNTTAPFIYGAPLVGQVIEVDVGVWSSKPNDCDWATFDWKRNGVLIAGATGRTYTVTSADVGQPITCDGAMFNTGGKSATVTTAAVTPRAAPTAPDVVTTLGSALADYWLVDGPDTSCEIYAKTIKAPGVASQSYRGVEAWGGELQLTQLIQFNKPCNVQLNGWLLDKSRALNFEPWRDSPPGRMWTNFGSGTEPAHLWVVVQRSLNNQQQVNGPIIKAYGHDTYVTTTGGDATQNMLFNNAGGSQRTLTTNFGKGTAGVLYHARNSQGCLAGFNNVISSVNANLATFDRETNFGYNGAYFMIKAIYWSNADIITTQQYASIQAYLQQRYLGG